jgi:hypothetical protein
MHSAIPARIHYRRFEVLAAVTVACRPVARQRPQNKQLYNCRYQRAVRKQQQRNGVYCAVRAEML